MKETGVRGHRGTYRLIQDGWAWIWESEIIIFLYAYADQYNHDKHSLPVVFYMLIQPSIPNLSVNAIKWPGIREARIPHLIDHFYCLYVVFAGRSVHHRSHRSRSYTILMLLCQSPIVPRPELSHPPALSTQTRSSNLFPISSIP